MFFLTIFFLVIYYFDCCKFGISNLNVVFYMNFNFGHLCFTNSYCLEICLFFFTTCITYFLLFFILVVVESLIFLVGLLIQASLLVHFCF
jgi:hypothetical protein